MNKYWHVATVEREGLTVVVVVAVDSAADSGDDAEIEKETEAGSSEEDVPDNVNENGKAFKVDEEMSIVLTELDAEVISYELTLEDVEVNKLSFETEDDVILVIAIVVVRYNAVGFT